MDHTLEEWAKSLVGRDWEIYWTDDENSKNREARGTQNELVPVVDTTAPAEGANGSKEDKDESREDVDEEDWYDGHVEEIDEASSEVGSKYSFRVRFVGDETIYTMVLEPKIVRPSVRAWIKRSKALLSSPSQPSSRSVVDWEKSLPPDTRTLDDEELLARIKLVPATDGCRAPAQSIDVSSLPPDQQDMPNSKELDQIKHLSTLLSAQLYLRSKLAPIVEHSGGPSEAYVDHLIDCLRCLESASQWYMKCWRLHCKIFFATTEGSTKFDADYAIREGLQEGRCVITNLLRIDTSLAGSKRRRPAENSPCGTRKTKRRRRNKSLLDFIKESERGSKIPKPEEDEFLSSNAVINFVDQVQCNDHRWYTRHFGKMIQSLSTKIVAPLLTWKHRVETILGDRPESEIEGDQTDGETSDEDSDEEDNESKETSRSEQRFYCFDEIQSFEESCMNAQVLRHFDLSNLQVRLRGKLLDIKNFETSCWSAVSNVFSAPVGGAVLKENDNIYRELDRLRKCSSTSSLNNVNPIGTSSSVLCRKVLDDALTIRCWYLDLHRVESSRERLVFIDKMATRASELPRLPHCEYSASLDSLFDERVTRLRRISQGYFDHLTRFNKYRSILLSRSNVGNEEEVDFTTVQGVSNALKALGEIQVLSIAEEMLAVRLDVLHWADSSKNLLSKPRISFEDLVESKRALDAILVGRSQTRTRILASIEANDSVDSEIRSFAEADVTGFCGELVSLVNSKYTMSCTWKEKADSVVFAIKQHSGQQNSAQKLLPMVDLRRIHGLIREYQDSAIFFPDVLNFLSDVYKAAITWSEELTAFILDSSKPFSTLLSRLQNSKDDRPKGVINEPPRHVVDMLLDVLQWHQQSIEAMKVAGCNHGFTKGTHQSTAGTSPSMSKCVYSLVAEGSEILEAFGEKMECFTVNSVVAVNLMAKELDSRRTAKVLSCTKLESNVLGSSLLDRIMSEDAKEGSPLRFLLFYLWRASIADLIEKYASKKGTKEPISLEAALNLAKRRPAPACLDGESQSRDWGVCQTNEEVALLELVSAAKKHEEEALRLLAASKEMFRGPGRRVEAVQDFAQTVKDLLYRFKLPFASNGSGLALSKTLEQQLDHLSKVLAWLIRTFPYPFLHQVHYELDPENRMPWDVLVSLNERKPSGLESMGDCAGISLRVSEVYEAASAWQTEITKVTMLSNRGAKRRGEETEGNPQATVDVQQVRRLCLDPVLRKVAMPRESAVSEILASAKNFEKHLHNFLGKDFDETRGASHWQDRAPYPDNRSLLGRSGEFLLYRLTGSPLYTSLISRIEEISAIAKDVFADTPGKAAFEWIRQAVSWIDLLRCAVKSKSYAEAGGIKRLVIAEADARAILDQGKNFFLDIPEDLKKTLSTHRIFMSTNKVDGKLKVTFKKGGAHHSIGGTAIKWCPILFDSLREDIARLESWKDKTDQLKSRLCAYTSDITEIRDKKDEVLLRLMGFHEELALLLEEGIESLVIAPSKDALDKINEVHAELQRHLKSLLHELSLINLNEQVARRRFEDRELLLQDRFKLLDALLARSSLEFENSDQPDPAPIVKVIDADGSFRHSHRISIDEALQSAARMLGVTQHDAAFPETAYFSVKAEEIEHAIFARFQKDPSKTMSAEYKEKIRTLSWVLKDCINPKLCLQVLLEEIGPAEIVCLEDKELIGDCKSFFDADHNNDESENAFTETASREGAGDDAILLPYGSLPVPEKEAQITSDSNAGLEEEIHSLRVAAQSVQACEALSEAIVETAKLAAGRRPDAPPSLAAAPRPDAPPSLAASLVYSGTKRSHGASASSSGKVSKKGKYVLNSSWNDYFSFAVSKPLIKFKARLCLGSDQRGELQGVLPESLIERGRLRIEEFSKFLSGKLKGGKWTAILLRMSVPSDEDAKKHKKFYREYESMKRIAMFSVSEDFKLFLVSPKFHRVAAKILGNSFDVETSTYAVALTRAA